MPLSAERLAERLDAALPVATFPFSGSTQAYAKSRGDGSGGHTVHPPDHFLSTSGHKLAFLWLFTLFLARLLVCLLTSNLPNEERGNNLSEHNT